MYRYRYWYDTVFGMNIADIVADSDEEADAKFWDGKLRDLNKVLLLEKTVLSADGDGDEAANERGEGPSGSGRDEFERGVVASGEHDEAARDGGAALGPKPLNRDAGNRLVLQRVEDKLVLAIGKGDEVKVVKLPKHRFLVYGPLDVLRLEPPLEVSDFSGVLSDFPEVDEQVGGNGLHD